MWKAAGRYDENWNIYFTWWQKQFFCIKNEEDEGYEKKETTDIADAFFRRRQLWEFNWGEGELRDQEIEVDDDSHYLTAIIPKQIFDYSETFFDIVSFIKHLLKFLLILVFLDSFFFMNGLSIYFIWLIGYQMLVHFPFISVPIPGHVMRFL